MPIIEEDGSSPEPPVPSKNPTVTDLEVISRTQKMKAEYEEEMGKLKKDSI
jgi:hypothetical protein